MSICKQFPATNTILNSNNHGESPVSLLASSVLLILTIGKTCFMVVQVVHKYGVIFVSSAGNAGPALSTVGAPGGTSSAILSIGAYVSPAMAAVAHSVRQEMAEVRFVSCVVGKVPLDADW